jgi:hypothetical protein
MVSPAVSLPGAARPLTPAARDRRFFTTVAAIIAAVVLVGFGPTFYLRPMFNPATPMRTVYYVHGAIFTVWVALFVTQAVLVSARRLDLHKKLGLAGVVLAVLMVVTGYAAAVTSARHGFRGEGLPPPLVFFAVPFFDLLVFSTLAAAGFWMRRSPVAHKRLMLLSMVSILTAAIARLPYVLPLGPLAFFGLTDLFVVALALHDRASLGRVHPTTLWGGVWLVASQIGRLVISGTAAWLAFATWLTR